MLLLSYWWLFYCWLVWISNSVCNFGVVLSVVIMAIYLWFLIRKLPFYVSFCKKCIWVFSLKLYNLCWEWVECTFFISQQNLNFVPLWFETSYCLKYTWIHWYSVLWRMDVDWTSILIVVYRSSVDLGIWSWVWVTLNSKHFYSQVSSNL